MNEENFIMKEYLGFSSWELDSEQQQQQQQQLRSTALRSERAAGEPCVTVYDLEFPTAVNISEFLLLKHSPSEFWLAPKFF